MNARPKVILVSIAFFLAGGALVASGIGRPDNHLLGGTVAIIWGSLLVFLALLLVLIITQDPYPAGLGQRGATKKNGRAHFLRFKAGNAEQHDIVYRWDQVWGWITVTVDDVLVAKQLAILSFRLLRVLEFQVGVDEVHTVRIEKRRTLLASFANPQPTQAFVDKELVASDDGIAASRAAE